MAHKRTTIRDAIKAKLSGETDADTRVYSARPNPAFRTELPMIFVFTQEEVSTPITITQPQLKRTMKVSIEAWLEDNTGTDDALDEFAKDIEIAMGADDGAISGALQGTLVETEFDFFHRSEKQLGAVTLTYDVDYVTNQGNPEA